MRQPKWRADGDEVGELEIGVIARMADLAQDGVGDDGAHGMGDKHDSPALMWNERLSQFRAQHHLRLAHFAVTLKDLLAFFVIEVQVLGNLAQGPVGEPVHTEFLFQEIDRRTAEIQTPRNYVVEEAVFILLQRAVLYFFIGPVVVELVEVDALSSCWEFL